MSQETRHSTREREEAPAEVDADLAQTAGAAATKAEAMDQDTQALLDELDAVMGDITEAEAEEAVAGFVQKGGQ